MAALAYYVISKEVKNHILIHNWVFRHTCINNAHWEISGIIIFLCKHYIVSLDKLVGSFLDVLFFCSLQYYQGFMRNQEGMKIELLKKVHRRICERAITFLTTRPPFYATFCCFLYLLPSPSQLKQLLNCPYKDNNIAMGGILCNEIMNKRSKIWKSLAIWY